MLHCKNHPKALELLDGLLKDHRDQKDEELMKIQKL